MKWLKENYELLTGLATAIVAVLGIFISYMTVRLTRQQNKAQREALQADREAAQLERTVAREAAQRDRFTYAIEHLKDESLAIRMGALFELKKLGLDNPKEQENIVRILSSFIKGRIENRKLLKKPKVQGGLPKPTEDVFLACEITSLFSVHGGKALLSYLTAEGVYLHSIELHGALLQRADLTDSIMNDADLIESDMCFANLQRASFERATLQRAILQEANLQDARLESANLQTTDLMKTNLQGANLKFANLQNANLTSANLRGADLAVADFREAFLGGANFQIACLIGVDFKGADFWEADLRGASLVGAKNLTATQLLNAIIDSSTRLDPDLRAKYDCLKAERDA